MAASAGTPSAFGSGASVIVASVSSSTAVAIHDAFDTARRRLEDFGRRQRGDVKTHSGSAGPQVRAPSLACGPGGSSPYCRESYGP